MSSFTSFHQLPLHKSMLKAVDKLGFTKLTPIQSQILPHTLAGQDAIGQAQTGTGKTATFLITLIEGLIQRPFKTQQTKSNHREKRYLGEPRAVILAPTRELTQQIFADCQELTEFTNLHSVCITGGVSYEEQLQELNKDYLDILIATPGRLIDYVYKHEIFLDRVEVLVLDEADRMLDMGFIPDIKRLVNRMPNNSERQSLLFSATFNQDVMNLAYRWLHNPQFIEIEPEHKTSENVEQHFYLLSEDEKIDALKHIIAQDDVNKVIVFANRRDQVKRLFYKLRETCQAVMLSGDVDQAKRERYLAKFKKANHQGGAKVMVATDVAGRGIHVDDISHVVNFTLPDQPDDYVHRIGRTGRAGQTGMSISFVSEDDAFNLPALEAHLETKCQLQQYAL